MATVTPGSGVPQRFDHLADRNLDLVERHLDDLRRPARPVPAPAARAMTAPRRIRVGVDTGGTFTDVVAFDEDTGELATTKTPSTPADPAEGFMDGMAKVLAVLGVGADAVTAVCHGTTVATNQLLEGRVGRLGFVTTEGSGPCWRSPARASPTATATATSGSSRPGSSPPTWSGPSAAGSTTPGPSCAPLTRTRPGRPPGTSATGR